VSYSYRLYGLNCIANISIAGLWPAQFSQEQADIHLQITADAPPWVQQTRTLPASSVHQKPLADGLPDSQLSVTVFGRNAFFRLAYSDGTQFVIDGTAKRLWGSCSSPLSADDLAVYLRGPALGFILRLRGIISLHASAISLLNRAVLFCGSSESGKSTIAAALSLRGNGVLCDDIAPFSFSDGSVHVEPGYPRVCLWPDAVQGLLGTPDALPPLTPTWDKRFLPLDGETAAFETQRLPAAVIYLLAGRSESNAPRIEEISLREALLELVQNTYMNWFLDREQRAAEFHRLSEIVAQVSVRRLIPQLNSWRMDELCRLITSDAVALINARQSVAAPVR
jgi:hypothetical protein